MHKVEISSRTIIFTVFFLLGLRFLWTIRDLIFSLFIAFIIMSALKPFVSSLEAKKIPRLLATILAYILFLGFFLTIIILVFPPLISESTSLLRSLPGIMENITPALQGVNIDISQQIPNLTNQFLGLASNVFSNTIFIISTLFFGFYFTLQENLLKGILARFFSAEKIRQVTAIVEKAEVRMSAWVWGEITLMTIVGVMTFVGLSLIGIRYALPLAVLAGLLEAVPNLGPTLSAIPAALIGFSQSYFMGFATIALFFIVQQVENNVVVPIVMKRAVGLNPIVTLIALIIGGKLAGIIGVLLAIPVTLFIETVLVEILKHQEPISPVEQPIR